MSETRHWFRGPVVLPGRVVPFGLVEVAGGQIRGIWDSEQGALPAADPGATVEVGRGLLVPGFIDVHVHGGGGADFMDGDPEGAAAITEMHARHGTTGMLATTLTAPEEEIIQAIRAARTAPLRGARILGFHIEGPFINLQMKGAQDPRYIRAASVAEIDRWMAEGGPGYRWHVTLAPEVEGAEAAIAHLVDRGAVVSAGHTNCTFDELARAAERGVCHATHLFNAMRGLHHREPGTVGAALTLPGLTVELIADGVHVHPAALHTAWKARGADRVLLVTDAMQATGMPDGDYRLGGLPATVRAGEARLADGTLAGSVLTMARAVHNMVRLAGVPVHEAVTMASLNPARRHRLEHRKGSIAPGKDADLAVLDEDFRVLMTMVEGKVVFDRR